MTTYRLYLFDRGGRVRAEADVPCANDREAIRIVNRYSEGHAMELRQGERLVRSFAPIP